MRGASTLPSADSALLNTAEELISIQTEIRTHFGWSLEDDLLHAEHLVRLAYSQFLFFNPNSTLTALHSRLSQHPGKIGIVGAAAEPGQIVEAVLKDSLLIVADGALGAILAAPATARPNLFAAIAAFVSDGDGGVDVIDAAISARLPIILHAHGDNTAQAAAVIEQIGEFQETQQTQQFQGTQNTQQTPQTQQTAQIPNTSINTYPLAITHACPNRIAGAHNPGGFTDGDRAACLAISMGIEPVRLHLIGHRSDIVGRWTGPTDPIRKLQKLEWMSRIFEMLGVKMDAIPPEAKGRGGE